MKILILTIIILIAVIVSLIVIIIICVSTLKDISKMIVPEWVMNLEKKENNIDTK